MGHSAEHLTVVIHLMKLGKFFFSTGVIRKPLGFFGELLRFYAVLVASYTIYGAGFSDWDNLGRMMIFLGLMLVLVFLLVGPTERSDPLKPNLFDFIFSSVSLATTVFFFLEIESITTRISLFDPLSPTYYFFGLATIVLSIEAARRTVGLGLTVIVLIFMGYNLFGHHLSGLMSHGYISIDHLIDLTVYTSDGLFSVPIQVAATYAFLFVMFGTILEKAGGGEFFFNLAAALTGKSPGGPAKVAVISSAMFGTISGSPTSDVVTTGSVTIPMMKRLGYDPRYASGVEVAASTGGSILPPVMGSAVFIMAEFTGISYLGIAIASIVPAFLYYLGIYIQVHLRSLKLGHASLPDDKIPKFWLTLKQGGLFLIPLVTLVVALIMHYTPTFVALYGIAAVLITWLFKYQSFSIKSLYDAVAQTTFNMVPVTGACAVAGLVIGGITMTGLAGKVSELVLLMADGNVFLTLIISAIAVIIFGMGMPTPAAYALAAALIAPTLVNTFNIPLLQAHMFLLYYSVLSAITPPVAVAAYAASAISGSNPLGIAVSGCKLAFFAFLLPFLIVYDPSILLQGSLPEIVLGIFTALGIVIFLSVAMEGYLGRPMSRLPRALLALAGACLIYHDLFISGVGILLATVGLLIHRFARVPVNEHA